MEELLERRRREGYSTVTKTVADFKQQQQQQITIRAPPQAQNKSATRLTKNLASILNSMVQLTQPTNQLTTTTTSSTTTTTKPHPWPPKPTQSTVSATPHCESSLLEDLAKNAKTFMYPTNVMSTAVVTAHQQVVLASIAKRTDPRREGIDQNVLQYTSHLWAQSTTDQRRSLWERFTKFRREQGPICTMDQAAAQFITTIPNISLGSRKSYAVGLGGLLRELQIPSPTLTMARKGMEKMGANIPEGKATPIRREQVAFLVEENKIKMPLLSLSYWLMWKTASRFNDILELRRENFKVVSEEEIVLVFGKHKANQSGTVLATSLCHILDPQPMKWQCALLQGMQPNDRVMPLSYSAFMARLGASIPDMTAHSFKHGAHEELTRLAQKGLIAIAQIPTLLKHSDPNNRFPDQTLAYATDEALIVYAREFKSGDMTRHL